MLTSLELTLLAFCFNCFSYVSEHTVLFHLKKGFFFPLNKYMLVVFSKHNQGRIDTRQWWKGRCLSGRKSLLWWHLVLPCLIQVSQYILVIKVDGLDTLTCVFRSICWGQTLRFFFLDCLLFLTCWSLLLIHGDVINFKKVNFGWERRTKIPDCFIVKIANPFWIVYINLYLNGVGGFFCQALEELSW